MAEYLSTRPQTVWINTTNQAEGATTIGELERGIRRNNQLAESYRAWLTAA